jgi:hypothetical protein
MRNSIPLALLAGAVAAVIGASIWAAITVSTGYQIGWIAVGVGILVGYAVRIAGQGVTVAFSIIGAVFALVGCVLGNLLAGISVIADELEIGFFDALLNFDYSVSFEILGAMFSPMDLLFYGIAIWEGFKFAPIEGVEVLGGGED